MNCETLNLLRSRGVSPRMPIRLEFLYWSVSETEARTLIAFLEAETDYDLTGRPDDREGHAWVVSGVTQPTEVTIEILDQWVEWMLEAGEVHGGSRFDGWGASIPPVTRGKRSIRRARR